MHTYTDCTTTPAEWQSTACEGRVGSKSGAGHNEDAHIHRLLNLICLLNGNQLVAANNIMLQPSNVMTESNTCMKLRPEPQAWSKSGSVG